VAGGANWQLVAIGSYSWGLGTALEMSRGTNIKLRTAEGHNQSSYKGTKVAAQMRTVGRGANNMALE
jgi:hypothetical protein